jgi:hypothetical protein
MMSCKLTGVRGCSYDPRTNGSDVSFTWRYQHTLPKVNPFADVANNNFGASGEGTQRLNPFHMAIGMEFTGSSVAPTSRGSIVKPTSPKTPLWSIPRSIFPKSNGSVNGGIGNGLSKAQSAHPHEGRSVSALRNTLPLLSRRSEGGVDKKAS